MADIQMLETKELSSVFKLWDDEPKKTWCVRVDDAGDEKPSHEDVTSLWAEKHLRDNHYFTGCPEN